MVKSFTIIPMVVEREKEDWFGLVVINENKITESAPDLVSLKTRMAALVYAFEGIRVDGFEIEEKGK
jgi:hypothetical protein